MQKRPYLITLTAFELGYLLASSRYEVDIPRAAIEARSSPYALDHERAHLHLSEGIVARVEAEIERRKGK